MWRRKRRAGTGTANAEPLTIAVVGLGAMGQRNTANLVKSSDFRLVGVYDLNSDHTKKIAKQSKSQAYENVDDILADDSVQSVFVCTPHHLLADLGLKVLDSGKHLLLEKPMAIDLASADAVIDKGRERNKTVSVNYSRAMTDSVQIARKLVQLGTIGDLTGVEVRWSYHRPAGYFQGVHSPTPDNWRLRKDKSGGGMVIMTTCHALHYMTHITGARVKTVAAFTPHADQNSVEETLYGTIKLENNAIGAVLTSSSQHGIQVNDTTIWGSNGSVILEGNNVRFYSTRVIEGKRPGKWYVEKGQGGELHLERWLTDTARSIRGEKPLEVDAKSARDTLAVIDALYRSAERGAVIHIDYQN